ncbi:MAG: hypothetical protein ACK5LL_07600 [Suipraeoptans sp.]
MAEENINQKYESDLTNKERRELQKQRLRQMGFKDKLGYLWEYYKFVLVIIAAVIMLISIIFSVVQNKNKDILLSLAVIDANRMETGIDEIEADKILEKIGTGEKNEMVNIDLSTSSDSEVQGNDAKLLITLSDVGENDLIICNESVYNRYKEQGAFADWEEVLGDDYEKYEDYIEGTMLSIPNSSHLADVGLYQYEPAYLCVTGHTDNYDNIRKFMEVYF